MFIALYILYALMQAILTARYVMRAKEGDAPVFMVVMMTLFAPLVTAFLVCGGFGEAVTWMVTYRPKGKQ